MHFQTRHVSFSRTLLWPTSESLWEETICSRGSTSSASAFGENFAFWINSSQWSQTPADTCFPLWKQPSTCWDLLGSLAVPGQQREFTSFPITLKHPNLTTSFRLQHERRTGVLLLHLQHWNPSAENGSSTRAEDSHSRWLPEEALTAICTLTTRWRYLLHIGASLYCNFKP